MLNASMTKLLIENFKRELDKKNITEPDQMRMEVSIFTHEIHNLIADYVEWGIANEKTDVYDYFYNFILDSVDAGRREQADDIS